MAIDHVLAKTLAEEHLGLAGLERMLHEPDDVEVQLCERAAHLVEAVLGLDDDFVEAVGERPDFLLLGEGAEVPLAAPVAAGAANPLIQHAAAVEFDTVLELRHEIRKLGVALVRAQLVRHLERDGHDHARIVREWRLRHEDLMVTIAEALNHFGGGLLPREVEEELLDVLDFERALLQGVLLEKIFHGCLSYPRHFRLKAEATEGNPDGDPSGTRNPEPALLRLERDDRVHPGGPPRRNVTRSERDGGEEKGDAGKRRPVVRAGAEEQRRDQRTR